MPGQWLALEMETQAGQDEDPERAGRWGRGRTERPTGRVSNAEGA